MPPALVKSFSKETDKSEKEVERLWNKAKELVNDQYPNVEKNSEKYYMLVTGILKRMVGKKDEEMYYDIRKIQSTNNSA